jgi:hypothetical protein
LDLVMTQQPQFEIVGRAVGLHVVVASLTWP